MGAWLLNAFSGEQPRISPNLLPGLCVWSSCRRFVFVGRADRLSDNLAQSHRMIGAIDRISR